MVNRPSASVFVRLSVKRPLTTDAGLHVLMVCERKDPNEGMDLRDEVRARLTRERLDVLARRLLRDIRRAADLEDRQTAADLASRDGFEIVDWSAQDRQAFRDAARIAWERAAEQSEDAAMVYEAQKDYLRLIGLLND